METLLADPAWEDAAGLFLGFFAIAVVPLVCLFLHHQRKMAAFFHQAAQPIADRENSKVDRLEAEVRELKDRMNQLILERDDRRDLRERLEPPRVPDRLR